MKPTVLITALIACFSSLQAAPLKLHTIFSSHMVLQRDKPIVIWGWADDGDKVAVEFAGQKAEATAKGKEGRWEVSFDAREASAEPLTLTTSSGDEKIVMENIVMGDVWVANGQSNMAWALQKTTTVDLELPKSNRPLLRHFRIQTNEQATMQTDINVERVTNGGWEVSHPEVAGGFSAIGYHFGANLQQALQIPIGIISNARGGASIESLVPRRKLAQDPLTRRYEQHVAKSEAEFDPRAKALENWEKEVAKAKRKNVPEEKWPKKPKGHENLSSWNIPGMSPSDAGACYNGMFGAFIGFNIKGVIFHQGYNNAMSGNCRPVRYRKIMKQMVEGWREDFKDPGLAVGIIGFCAGGIPQTEEGFESWTVGGAPYIREAQRLGLADVGDPQRTAFLPAYDIQIPGLHPLKKREHGERAARWALNRIYETATHWETASLKSSETKGDELILTFDRPVMPDDMSIIPEGFAIAGEDGKFYRAHARFRMTKDAGLWNTANKSYDASIIHLWSPLIEKPVAVRYAWGSSPMGNLKVQGKPWAPLANFRTDCWDWPESEDPEVSLVGRGENKAHAEDAAARLALRKKIEAEKAVEVMERLKTLGRVE